MAEQSQPPRRMTDPITGAGFTERESVGQAVPVGVVAPGAVALLASGINRAALGLHRLVRRARGRS